MTAPRTVLYLQHAGSLGGSCMSLLHMIQALDCARYRPVVALARPSERVASLYQDARIDTLPWPGLVTIDHSTVADRPWRSPVTWAALGRAGLGWARSERRTLELVERVRPALVHLNSMPLSSSACALARARVPFVWHVREPPAPGLLGARRRLIGGLLGKLPDEVIFISDSDQCAWLREGCGVVIPNFVPDALAARAAAPLDLHAALGLARNARIFTYLGGLSSAKGIEVLIEAMPRVLKVIEGAVCLMPGSTYLPSDRLRSRAVRRLLPVVGAGTLGQQVERRIEQLGISRACVRLPFRHDVDRLLAASELVVVPHTRPHFARPIIEAGIQGVPAVASDVGGPRELIEDGVTGLLTPPGDPAALAATILRALLQDEARRELGRRARARVLERHLASEALGRIQSIYDAILDDRQHAGKDAAGH